MRKQARFISLSMSNINNIDHTLKQALVSQVLNETKDFIREDPILNSALIARQAAIMTELRKKARIII